MPDSIYTFLTQGITGASIGQMVIAFFVLTFITVLCVTIYLHRCQAHRAVNLHPIVSHIMRFWLWLTTGMVTKEWVAIHRKHHAYCETEDDPHSPQVYGIHKVVFHGVQLYTDEGKNPETIEKFGRGTPNDWLERNLYGSRWIFGPTTMLILAFMLFGVAGITFWAMQMVWIPITAAGGINGIGHWWGYRNFHTEDTSTNISPVGVLLGGEELHNNHHAFPSSARFSQKWFEFDIGWAVIRGLSALRLAKVLRVAPTVERDPARKEVDLETVKAVFASRYALSKAYYKTVLKPQAKEELSKAGEHLRSLKRQAAKLLKTDSRFLNQPRRQRLNILLAENPKLKAVYEAREKLREIWERRQANSEALLEQLRQWISEAERSKNAYLRQFAEQLRSYQLRNATT